MKKVIAVFIVMIVMLSSCADSKTLNINGKDTVVEPYGWANESSTKVEGVVYQLNVGNIVWSVILSETLVVPIILTGYQLFEPVRAESKPVSVEKVEETK